MKNQNENRLEFDINFKTKLKNRLSVLVESKYRKHSAWQIWGWRIGYIFAAFILMIGINFAILPNSNVGVEGEFETIMAEFDKLMYELDGLDFDSPDLSEI